MKLAFAEHALRVGAKPDRILALIDMPELERRGWDAMTRRFVPSPSDPLFGYARCPVRGCENVTEHTATTLCARCQNRYRRWLRTREDGGLDGFLASVTQIRSEDPERVCLVCRTPGHQRPAHSAGLCDSCHATRTRRGQSITAYVEGDARYPRTTFGRCVLDCDALARGNDGICAEHWRHWRRVGAPRGAAFDRWASEVERPLPAARFLDLGGLPERVMLEVLVGLTVSIERPRRSRITELRRVINRLRAADVGSILELDARKIASDAVRLFIEFAQDRLRLAAADPETEFEKDVWDLRVFGSTQAWRMDFTALAQPWLRVLAKEWTREKVSAVHPHGLTNMIYALNELSRSLARREDEGALPAALGRGDITALLARLGRLQASGRLTAWQRRTTVARLAQFLREARDWGLGPGRALFGLPGDFTLSRQDVRALKKRWTPEPGRALPPVVLAQLLDEPALALLQRLQGPAARAAVQLLAATGRRPSEICELPWDCLAYDTDVDEHGSRGKLAVLVHDMPKVGRRGCRLPIDAATADAISAQKRWVAERFPDTRPGQRVLFPRVNCNPGGLLAMKEMALGRVIRRWVTALGVLLDSDGHAFPRERVIAYAFRHSYAQRHADNGTPVDVLAELMGHANMNTTQGYYTVRDVRKRKAVDMLAPLQIDCHGNPRTPVVAQLLASERLRQQIGQTAVPMGHCTEPSNVKAGGHSCPYRHRCFGCEHFRTDPSSQPELRDYLHKLLLDRERLAGAVPALADWALRDAAPSEQEITAVRALVRRNEELIEQLDPADRAAVIDAIAVTRRVRAQLATEIPARFRLATSQPRPTLTPRANRTANTSP
ncbi:MAG: tyrosine-type recombinase/integrase [Solirubrobacteraceae bacterium]